MDRVEDRASPPVRGIAHENQSRWLRAVMLRRRDLRRFPALLDASRPRTSPEQRLTALKGTSARILGTLGLEPTNQPQAS